MWLETHRTSQNKQYFSLLSSGIGRFDVASFNSKELSTLAERDEINCIKRKWKRRVEILLNGLRANRCKVCHHTFSCVNNMVILNILNSNGSSLPLCLLPSTPIDVLCRQFPSLCSRSLSVSVVHVTVIESE